VNTLEIVMAIFGLVIPLVMALLVIINKMHNGRVHALDIREKENNNRHLENYQRLSDIVTEERRISEERDERIFDKLDKATDKISDLATSIAGNYVSKDDCGRCKEA
jgi:fructose 1,6-bisphosphatase